MVTVPGIVAATAAAASTIAARNTDRRLLLIALATLVLLSNVIVVLSSSFVSGRSTTQSILSIQVSTSEVITSTVAETPQDHEIWSIRRASV
jgi:predicted MFS family arabinose efflux permease